jgi:hypothetical protein
VTDQGDSGETSREAAGEGEWLSVAAAARRLRVTPRAIRSRIEHGSLRWKAAGNSGKLVLIEPGEAPEEAPREEELERLRAELAELRERLTAALVIGGRAEERAALLQAALEREQARADRLEAAVQKLHEEALRPWWRRLLG